MPDYKLNLRWIKILLVGVINLFMLTGLIMCVIGIKFFSKNDVMSDLFDSAHYAPALMFMITGISIFGISSLGFYGVIKEGTALIFLFLVCLVITVIIELVGAVWLVLIQDNMMEFANARFNDLMSLYETNYEARVTVDLVQKSLKCCGASGPSDWMSLNHNNSTGNHPLQCCFGFSPNVSSKNCVKSFQNGCMNEIAALLFDNTSSIIITAFFVFVIQLTGICFSSILGKSIRSQKTERDMQIWHVRNIYLADKDVYQPLTSNESYINVRNI